jgi:fumarate hydratase subunit alpha
MLSERDFRATLEEMLKLAETTLPEDVVKALERSKAREQGAIAKKQLELMLENLELANQRGVPICQDTGIPIFFVEYGLDLDLGFDLNSVIPQAVQDATRSVPLRPNVVDPLDRKNTENNTGEWQPAIHVQLVPGEDLKIDLLVKGAGAENWSRLHMLGPTSSASDIEQVVLRTIEEAGGQPCPPTIVGVGIGGSADMACLLAKRALLRPVDETSDDRNLAKMERRLTKAANELGIGPMGLGGKTTVLGIHLEKADCHAASLPLAINFQCWVARRASARLIDDELRVEVP